MSWPSLAMKLQAWRSMCGWTANGISAALPSLHHHKHVGLGGVLPAQLAQGAEGFEPPREVLAGEQPAIIDRDLFDAVQARLSEQVTNHKVSRTGSEALLLGRIFDDRGHRMSPSHVRKRAIKYRYYLSSALLQGRPKQAGTVSRIPAREVETLIANAVRNHLRQPTEIEDTVRGIASPASSHIMGIMINAWPSELFRR